MKKIILFALLLLSLFGCSKKTQYTAYYTDVMDTFSTFECYCNSQEEFDALQKELHSYLIELHQKFDIYNNYEGINNIKTINDKAGIEAVKVDNDIIEILEKGKEAYNITNGNVNIAMGSVLELWHNCRVKAMDNPDEATIPSEIELQEANKHTSIDNIEIDKNNMTVYINDENTSIDVGAYAKGFIADKAREFLINKGVDAALLNLGGNIVCINSDYKPDWLIGIQDPDNNESYIEKLSLSNNSAVTSGSYQRYYEYNGEIYHHIIDPQSLMPANNNKSVTIVSEDSTLCDILSTAVFIMPYEEGRKLAENMDVDAYWVTNENEYYKYL